MPRSAVQTVSAYLQSLPPEPRAVVVAVRGVIRRALPAGYQEVVSGGMLCYVIPLRRYPHTYNGQPFVYAALAVQKNYFSLHLIGAYMDTRLRQELEAGFTAAGKRLDMGKGCVRFRRLADVPLPVIERSIARVPLEALIALCEASRARTSRAPSAARQRAPRTSAARRTPVRKPSRSQA
jgi:hypothetical protein